MLSRDERLAWLNLGTIVVSLTVIVLVFGRVAYLLAQSDQGAINLHQAEMTAGIAAQVQAIEHRVGAIENQINYVLGALVASLVAQFFQLRASKR